jgi:hypothetical protein
MEPTSFPQSNKTLGPPPGMTEEECGKLPIFTDGKQCVSLWQMNWRERLSALFVGRIWLFVMSGQTQPPVLLMAKKEIFVEMKERSHEEETTKG